MKANRKQSMARHGSQLNFPLGVLHSVHKVIIFSKDKT